MLYLTAIFYIFIFGGSFLAARKTKHLAWLSVLTLAWIILVCHSRWVLSPNGLIALILGLVALHFASWAIGLATQIKNNTKYTHKTALQLTCLLTLNACIVTSVYKTKGTTLGFDLYHIPSISMVPTLIPGDVILVNTWPQNLNSTGDIVLFKQTDEDTVYIKRIAGIGPENVEWKNNNGDSNYSQVAADEFFLLGDNQQYSRDSRAFGPIHKSGVIAKAEFIVFSLSHDWRLKNKRVLKYL